MQEDTGSEKISISLPRSLIRAIDSHLKSNESRSGYFQILVRADLEGKGLLEDSAHDKQSRRLKILEEIEPYTDVDAKLIELAQSVAMERAAQ